MTETSRKRSEDFLKISGQFKLGALTTEAPHPVTRDLSDIARQSPAAGLSLLFDVDEDVRSCYERFVESGRAATIKNELHQRLQNGGKLFFTGCGSTGRLSIQLVSIWRDFWQQQRAKGWPCTPTAQEWEDRAFAVMAGGDYALIKAVEGFEDFTAFGEKQLGELGVSERDVVFAITEGGETSFVIGTAWKGVEAGAKVYFVYNNPDSVLCQHVERSRQVIEDARIEKINLTTGPMAITGSTRMQATTIQLCVLLTVLEMVVRDKMRHLDPNGPWARETECVPKEMLNHLARLRAVFKSDELLRQLRALTAFEESVYRGGHKNNYFAATFAIDVLTDTTERSPTYCTPPFRKSGDTTATESWAFLFVPEATTPQAWKALMKREAKCLAWTEGELTGLVPAEKMPRTCEILRNITYSELMRFRIGLDGLAQRIPKPGDAAVGIVSESELDSLLSPAGFHRAQLESAHSAGAKIGLIYLGSEESMREVRAFLDGWNVPCTAVLVPVPKTNLLLDGATRLGLKMLLNALSTCTMVRLGRVMGNFMIWVVPSNLKLIDRSTRYIQKLTGLDYEAANRLLFEVIEYVEPRMKSDQAYPPVVALAVLRHRHGLGNREAEQQLSEGSG